MPKQADSTFQHFVALFQGVITHHRQFGDDEVRIVNALPKLDIE